MRLDIDFAFDVSNEERHTVTFHWGQLMGRIRITVDGLEVVAKNRAVPLGRTRTRTFEFSVGYAEVHDIVIEKIGARVLSGARKQKCRAFVDGELIGEY